MKKSTLLICLVLYTGISFAQSKITNITSKNKNVQFENVTSKTQSSTVKGVTIWSNDFSTPGDWSYANTSVPFLDWCITTAADTIPVTGLNPAQFTSVNNGFAFINSDAQGETATQDADMTYNGSIDCSGYPNVSLVFEQSYRTYLDTRIIRVSNDGGATWTDFIITDGTEPTAQNTANPDIASVNISSVAGGQANVMIQLNYQGNWGWYWAIDDIKIIETDQYDLKLQSIQWGTDGAFGPRLPYYQVPNQQVAPVNFGGIVKNIGVQDINDALFTANINALYSGLSGATAVAAATQDTLWCTTTFTPSTTNAIHTVQFGVSSSATELDLTNNTTGDININVNDYIYARDKDVILGGIFNGGQGFEVGPIYDIFTNASLYGIDGIIGATSVVGAEIFAKLYYVDPATGDFIFVDESLPYIITNADLGQKHTFGLQAPQALTAGDSYLVMLGSYGDGGSSNDLVVGTSGGAEAQTVFYYDYTDQTWYYTSAACMVRMNFDPTAGVSEIENQSQFTMVPNPASSEITLSFPGMIQGQINITDLSGNKLMETMVTGPSQSISTQSLSSGVYFVNVFRENTVQTQKLIICK